MEAVHSSSQSWGISAFSKEYEESVRFWYVMDDCCSVPIKGVAPMKGLLGKKGAENRPINHFLAQKK